MKKKTRKSMKSFLKYHPGPFLVVPGKDGVDSTYDIYCKSSKSYFISVHYWEQEAWAQCVATAITHLLNENRQLSR